MRLQNWALSSEPPGTQRPLAEQPGPALSSWSWCPVRKRTVWDDLCCSTDLSNNWELVVMAGDFSMIE